MNTVKEGSLWGATEINGIKKFRVLSITEIEGNTWVHYREERSLFPSPECKEYSCYIESFVERFRKLPE